MPSAVNETSSTNAQAHNLGVIILKSGTNQCKHLIFDNRTGNFSMSTTSCDDDAVDAHGVPIPQGTAHTLNAISKSFK